MARAVLVSPTDHPTLMTNITSTAASRIADFVAGFSEDALDAAGARMVGRAIIDTVGIALAAVDDPACEIALGHVRQEYGSGAQRHASPNTGLGQTIQAVDARIWTHAERSSIPGAAFYNGFAGHLLDFDDVSSPLRGHPSIAMLPALLALGEARGCSGKRLASAYAVGLEVMVRIARAMVSDHYAKGWHATTTIGVLGAAAACSHLLGLSPAQIVNALGLAFAQASGSRASFGTMAKSFQTGHCNASALRAALLAEAGMDAAPDSLDGPQGFSRLYGNGEALATQLDTLGHTSLELFTSGLEIKKYPMCYAAHRSIDGVLDLRREHDIRASDVIGIQVTSNHRGMVPLIHPNAQTGLQGKFSMHYAMAAALLDGEVRLSSFTDDAVQRAEIRRLMSVVSAVEADGPATPRWNVVSITLRDGTRHEKEIRSLRGSHELPLSDEELRAKWADCLQFGGYTDEEGRFFEAALGLETRSVAELSAALPGRNAA